MQAFESSRDAKTFLVTSIIAEAKLEGSPLSKIEGDMLYFTETAWCPLENCLETNEAFESEYDTEEYEQKIEALIRNFKARASKENPNDLAAWNLAVRKIDSEDHYLLVMIRASNAGSGSSERISRPLIYLGAMVLAILITAVIAVIASR